MDFGNKPFETNRLKERFVNYYSNKMPGSPVMSELYWDAHDDLGKFHFRWSKNSVIVIGKAA